MIAVGQSPGRVRTEILDENDEVHPYTIEVADPIWDDIAFRVVRLDATKDGDYRTARNRAGKWRCNCGDSIYRGRQRACKHVKHLKQLWSIVETMTEPTTPSATRSVDEITNALAAPFDPSEVKFKPGATSGGRALAMPYVDARVVQDRLDEVLGIHNWQDEYDVLDDKSVVCRLRVRIGGEWITKTDVGGQSEQPDEGYRCKAAFSDALKRTAVKFGVGRYLYRQKPQWCDWDAQKRQFVRPPSLSPQPQAATPRPATKPASPPPHTVTSGMISRFVDLVAQLQIDKAEARQRLIDSYHPADCERELELSRVFGKLAPSQAQDAIDKLERALLARRTAKATA